MNKETLRMQMLAGVITESQYKQKLVEGLGNEVGDKVYFKSEELKEKYPSSEGYYGVIKDATPASNYNTLATYEVDVFDKDGNEITTLKTNWTDLSTKPN